MSGIRATILSALALLCCTSSSAARTATLIWRSVGPGGGGAIQSVAMDPQDVNTIHVGSDLGGYYKSTDGGKTFRILNNGLTDYFVARILVHPTRNNVIYLGTLSGVFMSIDGGMSWAPKRNGFPPPQQYSHSAPVSVLVMDPTDARTIYAGIGESRWMTGGRGHVYKTVDGAESWERLDGIARYAGDAIIQQLAVRSDDPAVLFAATNQGVFRSADAGVTWERRNIGLPHLFCRDIAIHLREPNTMYVVMRSTPGETPWRGGVYRSDDGGGSWTERNEGLLQHVGSTGSASRETCNYSCLALDPRDPEHLYVGSDSWWGAGLYESTDGGGTWQLITPWDENENVDDGWITFWGATVMCVSASPLQPETMVYGDIGRLMRSDDGGGHWNQLYTQTLPQGRWQGNGLEVTCLYEIAVDPFRSSRLYCGYADIGLMVSEDSGHSWRRHVEGLRAGGDVARVVCDPARESIAWCCEGRPGAAQGCVAVTGNGGLDWEVTGSGATGLPEGPVGLLVLDPDSHLDARTLFAVSYGNGVYKSVDGGKTWGAVNNGFGDLPIDISDLVMDPANSRRLLAARTWSEENPLGGLYLTDSGGEEWRKINRDTELPDIQSVAVSPRDRQSIFVGCSEYYSQALGRTFAGGVFRSDDGGTTWKKILEDRAVVCVRISPFDPNTIYVATTRYPYHDGAVARGVLASRDRGDTWVEVNEGLTNKNVKVIALDPHDPERIYAGTAGNGFFIGRWE